MEKRKFEKLDIETSLLGFGCMRFPESEGKIDYDLAEKMIDLAMESGVNYYDTAYPYHNGESEPFLGKVLDKYDRDSYYLATKLPVWEVKRIDDAKRIFEEQRVRLNKEYFDFYLLHALNLKKYMQMKAIGVVEYLKELKAEGKIKYLGFSFHDDYTAFEYIIKDQDWDFCQIQLNYMDVEEQAGMKGYELAEKLGVPIVIMEPVKGGTLASFSQDIEQKFYDLDTDKSIASYALRFVGSLSNIKVILSGMSNMEQVMDNLKTFQQFQELSDKERATINEVVEELNKRTKNGCTGCRYCIPCPAGIKIPTYFRLWNTYFKYQNFQVVSGEWKEFNQNANACLHCKKCVSKCPQKINIPEDLKHAHEELDKACEAK